WEIKSKEGEAITLGNIGTIYEDMGRPDEALKYISNALQYWRQIDNIKEEAKYLKIMGDIYLSKEKIEDAVYLYRDAIDIYEELKDNDKVRELKEKVNSLISEESIA
ncbi:MAG: tetratricopeptide repeat protein, partial [Nitrospinae bacterium]|nr:tetratricopeptide repeat protein [Nitrospinota bacterium]